MSGSYNIIAEGGGLGPILVIVAIMAFRFVGKIITERAAQKEEEEKALEKGMRPQSQSQGEQRYKPIGEPTQQPRAQPAQRAAATQDAKDLPYARRHARKETKESKQILRPQQARRERAAGPVIQRHLREEHLPVAKAVAEQPRRPRPTQKRPAKPVAVRQPQRREPEPAKPVEVVEKQPQSPLTAALGDTENLRRAIVLSEILGKPVSLRTGSQQY